MPPSFNDVAATHLFYHDIEAIFAAGITQGTSVDPPLFSPDDSTTVSQMMVFLTRAVHWKDNDIPVDDASLPVLWSDVAASHWAYPNIQKAAKLGINGAQELDDFSPGVLGEATAVKRKWAVCWTVRALVLEELIVTVARFTDVPVGYYLGGWIERAAAEGITRGNSPTTFNPDGTMTRGEMAAFLRRAFDVPFVTGNPPEQ